MRTLVNSLRLIAVIAAIAAVVGQWLASSEVAGYSPWNFFGYFTIQSNIIVAVTFAVTLVVAARRKRAQLGVSLLRGAATVYIATTGIVYNTLLSDVVAADTVPWSNELLHRVIPAYVVLDWLLFSDRSRLLFRHIWWFVLYPVVWSVVVLIRGATDGWVPYPFLDPAQGYGIVTIYCVGIAVSIALLGVLVVGMSRLRLVKL